MVAPHLEAIALLLPSLTKQVWMVGMSPCIMHMGVRAHSDVGSRATEQPGTPPVGVGVSIEL